MAVSYTCRICQNRSGNRRFSSNAYTLMECGSCGFVQVNEEPSAEELEQIYQQVYFSHNKYRDASTLDKENQRRLALVVSYLPNANAQLLDAGCGSGDFLRLAKHCFEVSGCDISKFAIEQARAKNPEIAARLSAGRLEEQEFPPASFDGICMWDVIEHLWNPVGVATQLMHFLRPGGCLFFSTPNIDTPFARLTGKYWPFMTPPEHLSFFTPRSISCLFEQQLNATIKEWKTKGKWVNCGFILYKLRRKVRFVPTTLIRLFETRLLARLAVYIPTGDIQYVAIQKALRQET